MSFRLKRIEKRTQQNTQIARKDQKRPYLITFGESNCDCPICREMGIDLDASGGVDARPLDDPAQFDKVMAMLEAARRGSSN